MNNLRCIVITRTGKLALFMTTVYANLAKTKENVLLKSEKVNENVIGRNCCKYFDLFAGNE